MATTFAVPDGRVAMAATTYTGTGATQTISNAVNTVSFQPDFVWVKRRDAVQDHNVYDSVRGSTSGYLNQLLTNQTGIENTYGSGVYGAVSALNSSGFTVASSNSDWRLTNNSSATYVGWQWNAGGTTVTNGVGTISSQVRANTTAGFSVVTYTGTLSAVGTATVGHGLGAAPAMIITKARSGVSDWNVNHVSLATWSYLCFLNTTDVALNSSANGTIVAPTNTVFTTNYSTGMNVSGVTQVAYCWAPVAGYSAFGSYTGNGSADGPFIYTGFRPRWLMIKRTDATLSWGIFDTSRNPSNVVNLQLYANLSAADNTFTTMDIVSNGFKSRSATEYNTSGGTYIYAAFAENPLKYANAR